MTSRIGSLKYALNGVYSGGTPTAGDESFYDDDGSPFVTIGDMSAQTPIFSTKRHLSERGRQSKNLKTVEKGTVILSMYATIGLPNILGIDACISQAIIALFTRRDQNPRFLYWWLMHYRGFLEAEVAGSTQGNLNAERVKNIRFRFTDIATQRQIADFLDRETARIDLLIEKKQRLVALLGEKETGLVDSLFFHVGSTETTTWKRYRVPRTRGGFELKKLSYVCSLLRDGTHQPPARVDEGYPLLSVRNIVDGKFILRGDDSKISEDDFRALCKSFEVKQGDVLLAVVGATLGKSAVVEEMPAVQIQRSLAIMRPLPDAIDGRYLLLFLRSGFFQELLWSNTSFSAQPGVYLSSLGSFPIAVPKISRQREIVWDFERIAASLGEIKSKTNTSIERLKEYRSALITAAVTGQIDVQTYARSGTPDRRLDTIQEDMGA